MATRRRKAAVSTGAALAGVALVAGLVWVATRKPAPEDGDKAPEDSKPPPTYEPEDGPPLSAPAPVIVGAWCSSVPSAGAPPALDPAIEAWVLEDADTRLPWLWLALSLFVTRYRDTLPTLDELRDDHDRASGESAYSERTQKALDALLVDRTVGADKPRDLIDAYRAFEARDPAKDRPCPVSVSADLATRLQEWSEDTATLIATGGV